MNTPSAPPETPRMAASATTFPVNPYAAPPEPPVMAAPATTNLVNPPPAALQSGPRRPATWSSGLLDCHKNVSICCITCWCPCITFGQIAEIVDRGSTPCGVSGVMYSIVMLVTGCPWIYSLFYRSRLRGQYFMEEKPCMDCCVHFWCEPCALCQEYRELEKQGYDMSIGWHGNLERRQRGKAVMAPSVEGGMMR